LKVACVSLQCVGFNQEIYRSVLEHSTKLNQSKWKPLNTGTLAMSNVNSPASLQPVLQALKVVLPVTLNWHPRLSALQLNPLLLFQDLSLLLSWVLRALDSARLLLDWDWAMERLGICLQHCWVKVITGRYFRQLGMRIYKVMKMPELGIERG
jgi:hypothetical protein